MSLHIQTSSNPEDCASRIFAHEADLMAGPQNELRTAIAGLDGLIELLADRNRSADVELHEQNVVRIKRLMNIRKHLMKKVCENEAC